MLFCRLAPARPSLQGPHIHTCARWPRHRAALSTPPRGGGGGGGAGDGCVLFPTPAEQKRGGSVADTQPEASPPVWEQNASPGPVLSTPEAGWAAEEGNWTPDFSRFCASPCQAVLSHHAGGGLEHSLLSRLAWNGINTGLSLLMYRVAGRVLSGPDCTEPVRAWPQRPLGGGRQSLDARIRQTCSAHFPAEPGTEWPLSHSEPVSLTVDEESSLSHEDVQ